MKKVYIDTNFFIYLLEDNLKYSEICKTLFERIALDCELYTSSLTLLELTGKSNFSNKQIEDLKKKFYEQEYVSIRDITIDSISKSIDMRRKYKLKLADAIHVGTAKELRCDTFITNDEEFLKITDFKILYLEDLV